MEIEPPDSLYGLYQGTPLPERSWADGNRLPDRITIFQRPIEEDCDDEDDVRAVIGETLIHEVGHYFGLSEEEIEEIEEHYWRGDTLGRTTDEPGHDERADGACRARKRFGQHFLEPAWVAKLVDAIDADAATTPSSRSAPAAARSRGRWRHASARLVAVEIDRDLAAALPADGAADTSRVVEGDFLDIDLAALLADETRRRCAWSATCPTTSRRRSCSGCSRPPTTGAVLADATLMLQKEVADRLVADVRAASDYGALAIQVALGADVERLLDAAAGRVPAAAQGHLGGGPPALPPAGASTSATAHVFERLVRGVFLQRRKTLLQRARAGRRRAGPVGRGTRLSGQGLTRQSRPGELTARRTSPGLSRAVL